MSQENVEVVRRFETSWANRNLEAALECVHDDLEFDWSDSMGPFVGTYKRRAGLTRFWTDMLEAWERFSPEIEEIIDCGPERLITLDVVRARGKGSGIDMEARGAMLWTVQEGRISRVKMFQTKDEALEAVRLSEQDARAIGSTYRAGTNAGTALRPSPRRGGSGVEAVPEVPRFPPMAGLRARRGACTALGS
jgi:ketosteroid isomerase-like protein